jgi:hypothetical protein
MGNLELCQEAIGNEYHHDPEADYLFQEDGIDLFLKVIELSVQDSIQVDDNDDKLQKAAKMSPA